MKEWIKNLLTDEEKLKYVKFGIFPFLAVILIIVIVVVDKPSTRSQEPETTTEAETTAAYVLDDGAAAKAAAPLAENAVPEVQTLMENYFQARLTCDPELLRQVFDSASMGEDSDLIDRMSQQTEHIESYQNIVCYTKEGLVPDSYVVFVRFDIKFLKTDTLAPSLLWCYVAKGGDGTYKIVEVPDEATSHYIAEVEKADDVIALADTVNSELQAAVTADGKLASIYNVLRTGLTDDGEEESQAADGTSGAAEETTVSDTSSADGTGIPAESAATEAAAPAETTPTETTQAETSQAETSAAQS